LQSVELQLPVAAAVDIAAEACHTFLSSHADCKELQLVLTASAGSPGIDTLSKHTAFTPSQTSSTSSVATADSTTPAASQPKCQQGFTFNLDKRLSVVEGSIVQLRDAGCPCAYIVNPIGLRAIKPFGKTGDAVHAACGEDLCKCARISCLLLSVHCANAHNHAKIWLAAFNRTSLLISSDRALCAFQLLVHVFCSHLFAVDAIREQRTPLSQPGVPYLLHLPHSCPLTVSQGVQSVIQVYPAASLSGSDNN
jgi:hypothetical protein